MFLFGSPCGSHRTAKRLAEEQEDFERPSEHAIHRPRLPLHGEPVNENKSRTPRPRRRNACPRAIRPAYQREFIHKDR